LFPLSFEGITLQVLCTSYPTSLIIFSIQSLSHSIGFSHVALEVSFSPSWCKTSPSWHKAFPSHGKALDIGGASSHYNAQLRMRAFQLATLNNQIIFFSSSIYKIIT
jgi:hypothetical protein